MCAPDRYRRTRPNYIDAGALADAQSYYYKVDEDGT